MKAELDALDPQGIAASVFDARRPELARALECVYAMPAALAEEAASAGVLWDERAANLSWKSPDGSARSFPTGRGHFDAEQAWEAVASSGLVSDAWLVSDQRTFETRALHRALLDRNMEPKRTSHPHTLKSCALVASDARAMETVETLAREACAALAPWGLAPIAQAIRWQFDDRSFFSRESSIFAAAPYPPNKSLVIDPADDPWQAVASVRNCDAVLRASRALGSVDRDLRATMGAPSGRGWRQRHAKVAFALAHDALRWDAAVREERRIHRPARDPKFPETLEGAFFASFSNPFALLATVFSLGYAVESVEGELHLICIEP